MRRPRPRHPSAPRVPVIAFLFADGPDWVEAPDARFRSTYARYLNALRRYLDFGEEAPLEKFRDKWVVIDGKRHAYLTDLATIDRLAEAGELHFEFYRR